jgi:hypothetical protein
MRTRSKGKEDIAPGVVRRFMWMIGARQCFAEGAIAI